MYALCSYSLGLFVDLSEAFDTLSHKNFVAKFELYGIRGTALKWLRSYLTNRKQYVDCNGVQSNYIRIGIPQ